MIVSAFCLCVIVSSERNRDIHTHVRRRYRRKSLGHCALAFHKRQKPHAGSQPVEDCQDDKMVIWEMFMVYYVHQPAERQLAPGLVHLMEAWR